MTDNRRNHYIDIVRGFAVFLMLWGHCIQYCVWKSDIDFFDNMVFKIIYSFHMPLFMLISGYMFFYSFSRRELKSLLVHRTQSLLQPIIFGSFFNYLITDAIIFFAAGNFLGIVNGQWMSNLSSLWFLWSVLLSSVSVAIVCKCLNNLVVQMVALFFFALIMIVFPNTEMNIYMYPYFIVGFYFAKYKNHIPIVMHRMKFLSLFLFPLLLLFYEKKHYIYTTGLYTNEYSLIDIFFVDIFRWIIGLVGSVFILIIWQFIYDRIVVKIKRPIISMCLSEMGKKSLQIYVFSVSFLSTYLPKIFPAVLTALGIENVFAKNVYVYNFVFTFLLAIGYSIILYIIVVVLEKIKITKIIFGK